MKPILRILVVCVVVLGIAAGLIWGFRSGRSEQAAEEQRDAPVEAPSRAAAEGGKTVLSFDEQAQRANGIAVTTLTADRRSAETQATGVVLQLQPLLDLKTSYNAALMDIAKARAAAQASQAEYRRVSQLNQGGQNVSEKSVETARAASESDAAVLQNAEQSLAVLKATSLGCGRRGLAPARRAATRRNAGTARVSATSNGSEQCWLQGSRPGGGAIPRQITCRRTSDLRAPAA